MLELRHFDLELLDLAARFLIDLAFSTAIFEASFPKLLVAFHPTIDLLVADVMLDGGFTIFTAILQTFPDDLDALFFGGFS